MFAFGKFSEIRIFVNTRDNILITNVKYFANYF